MEATIVNPVIRDDAGTKLREAAQAVDRGETPELTSSEPTPELAPADKEVIETPGVKPDNSVTKPEETPEQKVIRERDEQGKFLPNGEKVLKPDANKKPDSNFEKAKKEQERQKSVLANFEMEKQQARAQLEADRRQLEQQRTQLQQERERHQKDRPLDPLVTDQRFKSNDLIESGINVFINDAQAALQAGDIDKANQLLAQIPKVAAAALQKKEMELAQPQKEWRENFGKQWTDDMNAVIEKIPVLRDQESPHAKETIRILTEHPIVNQIPNGFWYAQEFARLSLEAGSVPELKEKNKQLEAEVTSLRGKTQLETSLPTSQVQPRGLNQGTMAERSARLRRASIEHDNQRAA